MAPPRSCVLALVVAVWAMFGCQPQIGDPCHSTSDCTDSTDRICDVTQPGGYCTIFNCEPNTCPEEAACVAFRLAPAANADCSNTQESARLQRSFCMKTCNQQSDCRAGYVCMDLNGASPQDNPWAAEVVESYGALVCVLPYSGPQPEDEHETAVCTAGPSTGSGTDPSTSGASDAGATGPVSSVSAADAEVGDGG